jgi:hypothetical protein
MTRVRAARWRGASSVLEPASELTRDRTRTSNQTTGREARSFVQNMHLVPSVVFIAGLQGHELSQ